MTGLVLLKLIHYLACAVMFGTLAWLVDPAYAAFGAIVGFFAGIVLLPRAVSLVFVRAHRVVVMVRGWTAKPGGVKDGDQKA